MTRATQTVHAGLLALAIAGSALLTPATSSAQPGFPTPPTWNFPAGAPAKLAAILISFDDPNFPVGHPNNQSATYPNSPTDAQIAAKLFGPSNSTAAWWREVSNDKFVVAGTVSDVYRVTIAFPYSPCLREEWGLAAMDALESGNSGFDRDDYDLIAFSNAAGCSGAGVPALTPPSAFMKSFDLRPTTHELGHALGLFHSSLLECATWPGDPSACSFTERGDNFCCMGMFGTLTYTGQKRGQLGWLDPTDTVTVMTDGMHTLLPIEVTAPGTKVLRIPRVLSDHGVEEYYYVEFKQPIGSDAALPANSPLYDGTVIRLGREYHRLDRTFLIPAGPGDLYANAPWVPTQPIGIIFEDSVTNTKITTTHVFRAARPENSYANVHVDLEDTLWCDYGPPTASAVDVSVPAGSTRPVRIILTNGDSADCPRVPIVGEFISLPAGWTSESLVDFERTMNGATTTVLERTVAPPIGASSGDVTLRVTNVYTGQSTVTTFHVTVL